MSERNENGGFTFEDMRTLDDLVHRRIDFDGNRLDVVPIAEHQRVQAEAAAMRRTLDVVRDTVSWRCGALFAPGHVQEGRSQPAVTDEALRAAVDAALSSSAGAALLEEVEGLRRERDELRAIPSGLFDALEATTTALEAAGLRSDLTKLARAVMRGEPEVLRAYRAESADLRARLERAERERDGAIRDLDGLREAWGTERAEFVQRDAALRLAMTQGLEAGVEEVVIALAQEKMSADAHAPAAWCAAEVRRAVEEETERIVRMLRARASGWGRDTPVGHALEVAAAAIRARGKA